MPVRLRPRAPPVIRLRGGSPGSHRGITTHERQRRTGAATINVKRWTKTSLRALHLVAVAGVGGGVLFGLDESLWIGYWWLSLVSGGLIMLMDVAANSLWLVQIRGLAVVGKLVLLAFLGSVPGWDRFLLILIIVTSAVVSHAPSNVRYYSVYHHRVVQTKNDTKG